MLRHLRQRGALPVPFVRDLAKLHGVSARALAPHVVAHGGAMRLKTEASLQVGQELRDLSFEMRVLLRDQADRLPFKVIDGRLCLPGALGCTGRESLLRAVQSRLDGVLVTDAVADYPGAHADVLALRRAGLVYSEGRRLWSYSGMQQLPGAAAMWLSV